MVRHGGLIQVANFLQLLNYRLAYYLIEAFRGTGALGLYAVANQLAESAWLAPKSLGVVLYSRLSNTPEAERQRDLTLTVTKAAVAFAVVVVLMLLLIPEPLFALLFGKEVRGLPPLVLLLAPGIVAMAASQAFSHFFSGVGRNKHNVIGSAIGLLITMVAGYVMIPSHGLEGAAITASLAYCGNTLYQAVVFLRSTHTSPRMLWFTRNDADTLGRLWRSAWRS
jgi:O-antigen/teichoic acid export membrane protein